MGLIITILVIIYFLYRYDVIYVIMANFIHIPNIKLEIGKEYTLLFKDVSFFLNHIKTVENPFIDLKDTFKYDIDTVKILDIKKGYVKYSTTWEREHTMTVNDFKTYIYTNQELSKLYEGV